MSTTDLIARRVEDFQPLPIVAMRLLKLMGNENHDARELIQIVSLDAALTLRVMSVANSTAYARMSRVTTMAQAVSLLGEQVVVGIAIGASSPTIYKNELQGYEADVGALWAHSLRTAIAAKEISRRCKTRISADEAFTAGILHDIGKAVINEFLAARLDDIETDLKMNPNRDFATVEREILGTDHTEVGEAMAKKWNIPARLCSAIRFHHKPGEANLEDQPFVYAIHLGDFLSMALGEGTGIDTLVHRLDDNYVKYFDLTHASIESIIAQIQSEFADANSLIS